MEKGCDGFGEQLNTMVPVQNLGQLRWYSGLYYERGSEKETPLITISEQTFAEDLAKKYDVS